MFISLLQIDPGDFPKGIGAHSQMFSSHTVKDNGDKYLVNGIQDETIEATYGAVTRRFLPLLLFCIVVVWTPQTLHQLFHRHPKLTRVDFSKLLESECPAMQARAKTNSSLSRVQLANKIIGH